MWSLSGSHPTSRVFRSREGGAGSESLVVEVVMGGVRGVSFRGGEGGLGDCHQLLLLVCLQNEKEKRLYSGFMCVFMCVRKLCVWAFAVRVFLHHFKK